MNIIERFKIGEPIQSLFHPRFSIKDNVKTRGVTISLMLYAPDTYNPDHVLTVQLDKLYAKEEIENDEYMVRRLRAQLHEALIHEADEAITVDGVRLFDPHRGGR